MTTPDYVKGYVAALRTMETIFTEAVTNLRKPFDDETTYTYCEKMLEVDGLEKAIEYIKTQRQSYKELVDKLNKENSGV